MGEEFISFQMLMGSVVFIIFLSTVYIRSSLQSQIDSNILGQVIKWDLEAFLIFWVNHGMLKIFNHSVKTAARLSFALAPCCTRHNKEWR